MSDSLKKLLSVEKEAATLVAEAEADVRARTAHARAEVHRRHEEFAKGKAAEHDAALAVERQRLTEERERRLAAFRAELAAQPRDPAALTRLLADLTASGAP